MPQKPFPSEDKPQYLFCGSAGRFCQLFFKRQPILQQTSFLTSILLSKRGMEKPNDKRKAEEDYIIKMTTPVTTEITLEGIIKKEEIKDEIRRTCREIFEGFSKEELISKMYDAFFPSTSANYIDGRGDAGAVGTILTTHEFNISRQPGGFLSKQESMESLKPLITEEEDIDINLYNENEMPLLGGLPKEVFSSSALDNAAKKLLKQCKIKALKTPNVAIAVILAEPLSYRAITKTNPYRLTCLRFIQKTCHSIMRKQSIFKLIGSPTGGEDNLESYLMLQLNKGFGDTFLSGDYKSATDLIFSWASETAAKELIKIFGLDETWESLLIDSLTRHQIKSDEIEEFQEPRKQTQGQLMGSITSFIILCILNAAVTRKSLEEAEGRRIRLEDAPFVINGDDVAFRSYDFAVESWREWIATVGFKESIGKTYESKNFVQINSRNFILEQRKLVPTPFINLGLIKGVKKSEGGAASLQSQTKQEKSLGARYRELMLLSPQDKLEEIHQLFIKYHKPELSKFRLPWYIPESLGGVGLTGFKNPSEEDLRIAQLLIFNWSKRRPVSLAGDIVQWKTWELAKARIQVPIYYTTNEDGRGVEKFKTMMQKEVINLIYDSNTKLGTLFPKDSKGQKEKIKKLKWEKIRHNERLWDLSRYKKLPPPLPLEKLNKQKMFETIYPDDDIPEEMEKEFKELIKAKVNNITLN